MSSSLSALTWKVGGGEPPGLYSSATPGGRGPMGDCQRTCFCASPVPPVFMGGVFSEITMCIAIFVYVMIGRNGYHLFQHRPLCQSRARQPKTLKMLKSNGNWSRPERTRRAGEGAAKKKTLVRLNLKCVVFVWKAWFTMLGTSGSQLENRTVAPPSHIPGIRQATSGRGSERGPFRSRRPRAPCAVRGAAQRPAEQGGAPAAAWPAWARLGPGPAKRRPRARRFRKTRKKHRETHFSGPGFCSGALFSSAFLVVTSAKFQREDRK